MTAPNPNCWICDGKGTFDGKTCPEIECVGGADPVDLEGLLLAGANRVNATPLEPERRLADLSPAVQEALGLLRPALCEQEPLWRALCTVMSALPAQGEQQGVALPDLPKPFHIEYHDIDHAEVPCYSETQMRAFAEAALSAAPAAPGRTLYIDLDGVMADFDGAFPAIFGLDHRSLADEEMWTRINGHASFFRDLPPMQGAIEFFRSVEHLRPVILTACPKSNYAHVAAQNRAWVREHLSQTCLVLPVLGGRNKALFMRQPGDILIDDWAKNCEAWSEAGGFAIKHEGDWIDTRAVLSTVLCEFAREAAAPHPDLSAYGPRLTSMHWYRACNEMEGVGAANAIYVRACAIAGAPAAPSAAWDLTGPTVGGATEADSSVQASTGGRSDG
ncbi:5' nucleotidase, NT5C type [Luteimonas fraxinea]|uniref:Uncharacterized protein n=1 Tax=Luteimonas fraxinea TaxID=2901869 RepID=A0ABS8U9J4_9GAMM|nr:hypothetical protein [Luteimonas fraxinea]MCD9096147.1 hypothetical protein [Luteimonas fraxinea]